MFPEEQKMNEGADVSKNKTKTKPDSVGDKQDCSQKLLQKANPPEHAGFGPPLLGPFEFTKMVELLPPPRSRLPLCSWSSSDAVFCCLALE